MKQVLNATDPMWEHSELALQCVNNYTGYKAVESLALYYFGSIVKLSECILRSTTQDYFNYLPVSLQKCA